MACFSTWKIFKSRFLTFWATFLGIDTDEKFWKKFQLLSLIESTNCMNFKHFHLNHYKWKNNNERAKSWNFKWPKNPFLTWYEKSALEDLCYGSPTTQIDGKRSKDRTFFFVTQCNYRYYQCIQMFKSMITNHTSSRFMDSDLFLLCLFHFFPLRISLLRMTSKWVIWLFMTYMATRPNVWLHMT